MEYEFGAGYAPVLARDLGLGSLGHVTAAEALGQGAAKGGPVPAGTSEAVGTKGVF